MRQTSSEGYYLCLWSSCTQRRYVAARVLVGGRPVTLLPGVPFNSPVGSLNRGRAYRHRHPETGDARCTAVTDVRDRRK